MDIKLYALIKAMVKGITKGDKGDRGDRGESGYPMIVEVNNPEEGYTLYNNAEYHITFEDILSCTVDFTKNHDGTDSDPTRGGQIVAIFTTPETGTGIALPSDISWSVSKPAWTKGLTYMLSFVPYGDKIIGTWAEVN